MKRMNTLYKISFSALFIALGIILSRFLSISYIFGLPFLKIGFTNSIVMFASFYLGPIYGFIVGTAVDVFTFLNVIAPVGLTICTKALPEWVVLAPAVPDVVLCDDGIITPSR